MKHSVIALTLAALTFFSYSCKKNTIKPEETTPTENAGENTVNMIKIGETFINGASAKAVIYGLKEPETGYNEFYIALFDSADGSRLSRGHFDLIPMMDMGSMKHSAPVENTDDSTTTNGYFKTAVIFSMPGTSGQWSLDLYFHNHKNEKHGTGKLALEVKASAPSKFKSTVVPKDNNTSVYISLVSPSKPTVGINDFEVILSKRISAMQYAPIDDYTLEIEPAMPSMGHGSPNNVNPVLTTGGHYKGKVNFTMSGLWQIKVKIYKNGNLISEDQYFEITI